MSCLPTNWTETSLAEIVDVHYGKALPEKNRESSGQVPVYGSSGAVGQHDFALTGGPSIVIGRKGAAGTVHLVDRPCWPIDTAYFLQPPTGINIRWLAYFLGSQQLVRLDKSTAIPSLSRDDLYRELITVAPTDEQTRIVAKLQELLSGLDAGVAELKAAQKKLAQYRQSLLKAAVAGNLTAEWRKNNPPIETGAELLERILKERRTRWEAKQLAKFQEQGKTPPKDWQKKYPEPIAPVPITEISIPETWQWTGLEQLSDGSPHGLKAGPFGSALKKEFYVPDGYKVYGQEQVIRGDTYYGDYFITKEKYEELISCAIKPGDLLISLVGTTGKILFLPKDARPGIINPRLLKISLSPTNVDPHYIKVVLESPYARHFYKQNAHGGTMDVLNLGILKALAVPIPSVEEQYQIVQQLSEQMDAIATQEKSIEISLKQAAAQRQNILRAAFAGQLVPQDPNDEPASVLLERIRAERASLDSTKKARTSKPRKAAT